MQQTRWELTPTQTKAFESTARFLDFEGAVRSGKTTIILLKALKYAKKYPGLCIWACRWKEGDAKAQLKPRIKEVWPEEFLGRWNADESCFECANDSRVYIRGLKPGEDKARYSKFTGKTIGIVYIDQPEEIPEDFWVALKARISQPGVPQAIWLTPNPPDEDHWLAKAFPDTDEEEHDGYQYIRTTVYDNRANLEPGYIEALEQDYPPGHVLRLRWIEGRRGLSIVGVPVYKDVFSRALHVTALAQFNPELPLIESWDFGHRHPAVLWSQFGLGRWTVLGELMGSDEFLESFAPMALTRRHELFSPIREVWTVCDPAGGFASGHGLAVKATDVLQEYGIYPVWQEGANHPVNRDGAIQAISKALQRMPGGIPAVQIHPRCQEYIRGLEGGYVWEEHRPAQQAIYPNVRRPKKDGRYDHLQNCGEYTWIQYGTVQVTQKQLEQQRERDYLRSLRQAQRDIDVYDVGRRRRRLGGRRGGF